MSLRKFHILFISVSVLLTFGYGGWSLRFYANEGGGIYLTMGLLSLLAGVGLLVYGRWFLREVHSRDDDDKRRRKLIKPIKVIAILVGLWVAGTDPVPACSVCYGEAEGPLIDAARAGVFLLFGLVLSVQIAFAWFFLQLRKRSKLQDAGGTVSSSSVTSRKGAA